MQKGQILKILTSRVALHIYFWIFIFSFFTTSNLRYDSLEISLTRNILLLPTDIITTYIVLYVILPMVQLKRQIVKPLLIFVFMNIAITLLAIYPPYTNIYIAADVPLRDMPFWSRLFSTISSSITLSGLATTLKLIKQYYSNQILRNTLKEQNLKNELALLRSNVNPHFLFNSLNNISSLTHISPDKTHESILKLSDLMRYMVYEGKNEFVSLDEELKYIENYVSLQKIRIDQEDYVHFTKNGDFSNAYISPMLLIPFVENAFKFCDKSTTPGIWIDCSMEKPQFSFNVCNTVKDFKSNLSSSSGFGIKNVRSRLNLLYKDKYSLKVKNEHGKYCVTLSLSLYLKSNE